MSGNNTISINAGGDVGLTGVAVGDNARAAVGGSAADALIREQFVQISEVFGQLRQSGELTPAQAGLLEEEAADVEKTALVAIKDESKKETLALKMQRFLTSFQGFCKNHEHLNLVFAAIQAVGTVTGVSLFGVGGLAGAIGA